MQKALSRTYPAPRQHSAHVTIKIHRRRLYPIVTHSERAADQRCTLSTGKRAAANASPLGQQGHCRSARGPLCEFITDADTKSLQLARAGLQVHGRSLGAHCQKYYHPPCPASATAMAADHPYARSPLTGPLVAVQQVKPPPRGPDCWTRGKTPPISHQSGPRP